GAGLPDELGDLLFQAVFLSQLLAEDGVADLASVARGQADKLVSRHPHVYGDVVAASAAGVVDVWERRKRQERADQGVFHELPPGLPALAFATKVQKRAGAVGFTFADAGAALVALEEELDELRADPGAAELGDVLFGAVAVARALRVDPEIALRTSARRFRSRVERAIALAAQAGEAFEEIAPERQLHWYELAHAAEEAVT
ncbi:MAG: MazG nucleotide pyrophosphohydrolase domain-containing protein, partial [Miltoncostaeaceae bacterium]